MSLNVLTQGGGTGGESASIFITGLDENSTVKATKDEKTVNGVWTQKVNPAIVVPSGYTQLEYIESTGTQYIDIPNLSATSAVSGSLIVSNYTSGVVLGMSSSGYGGYLDRGTYRPYGRTDYQWKSIDLNNDYNEVEFGYDYLIVNGVSRAGSSDTGNNLSGNVRLFGRIEPTNGASYGVLQLRYFTATQGSYTVKMYPVKRNSDGVVGLYDLVNGVFYQNNGTGTFIAGAETTSTIDGHLIPKIKSYGMWSVTATNGEKTTTQDILVDAAVEYEIEMYYRLYLYNYGDECEDVTGGWSVGTTSNGSGSITKNDNNITVVSSGINSARGVATNNIVNIANYSKSCMVADVSMQVYGGCAGWWGITPKRSWGFNESYPTGHVKFEGLYGYNRPQSDVKTGENVLFEGSLDGVTGNYYPFLCCAAMQGSELKVVLKQMWLE